MIIRLNTLVTYLILSYLILKSKKLQNLINNITNYIQQLSESLLGSVTKLVSAADSVNNCVGMRNFSSVRIDYSDIRGCVKRWRLWLCFAVTNE